ncbi:response regulator [Thalassotalea crassostreae]|uniref:response regulator n=1 Tax=Thalassotalea crassostreae TaxID=1763536 RepID=UPI0008397197|nr:response regulator [Thalassotalea crassostreae]
MNDNSLSKLEQKSVLLMNFENSATEQILTLIEHFNFNSNLATNKQQLDNYIKAKQYDLIIFFINNPDNKDAFSITSELRNQRATFKLPIVIISTIIEPNWVNSIVVAGVTEYIVPPLNQQVLMTRFIHAIEYPIRNHQTNMIVNPARTFTQKNISDLCVLVVDDISDNIEIITGVIGGSYKVKAAKNAAQAMKVCLSDSPPELVLLDIMMPGIDGLTFCKQLAANPLTQDIRVIFTSALTSTDDVVRGLKLGAVDYIPKPIIPEILLARIDVHSKLIIQRRALQAQIDLMLDNAQR